MAEWFASPRECGSCGKDSAMWTWCQDDFGPLPTCQTCSTDYVEYTGNDPEGEWLASISTDCLDRKITSVLPPKDVKDSTKDTKPLKNNTFAYCPDGHWFLIYWPITDDAKGPRGELRLSSADKNRRIDPDADACLFFDSLWESAANKKQVPYVELWAGVNTDFEIPLLDYGLVKKHPPVALLDWTDYGEPDPEVFMYAEWAVENVISAGKRLQIGCYAGHGRTGAFAALVLGLMQLGDKPVKGLGANAVAELRKLYCKSAIDTATQRKLIERYLDLRGEGYKADEALSITFSTDNDRAQAAVDTKAGK